MTCLLEESQNTLLGRRKRRSSSRAPAEQVHGVSKGMRRFCVLHSEQTKLIPCSAYGGAIYEFNQGGDENRPDHWQDTDQ